VERSSPRSSQRSATTRRDKISGLIRRWRLHRRIGLSLAELDGAFYRCALVSAPIAHQRLPDALDPQEIKRLRNHEEGRELLAARRLFAHWAWAHGSGWPG
jgi:hypothetical protein